ARGGGNRSFLAAARSFLARWPDPQHWASEPLAVRLSASKSARPFVNHLMLSGQLHPGYDYLLERKLPPVLREAAAGLLGEERARFLVAASELGYLPRVAAGLCSQIAMRLLIRAGRPLPELTDTDIAAFDAAITERENACGRPLKHYRDALYTSRTVIYHMGAPVTPVARKNTGPSALAVGTPLRRRRPRDRTLPGRLPRMRRGDPHPLDPAGHRRPARPLRPLSRRNRPGPNLPGRPGPAAPHRALPGRGRRGPQSAHRHGPLAVGAAQPDPDRRADDRRHHRMGLEGSPAPRLIFARDVPRLPPALPRYLPPGGDRALAAGLRASPNRLRAGALLLLRAAGMRIGELLDLELDCVHEVPGAGAWLKVPLGKLDSERMVPIDDGALALIDQITQNRSPGRPLPHPRTGKPADFLLTHQGRRLSAHTLRGELHRAAAEAGITSATPHQLRHTYATALVNSGVPLQALMALLGHVSAEMSLRYGR